MNAQQLVNTLRSSKEFFDRGTRCLEEQHSTYTPAEGMFNTAQQVAHVAQTIDWFVEGASRPEGFDMNFDAHVAAVAKMKSLREARAWLDKSFAKATQFIGSKSPKELERKLPEGPVMGGAPIPSIVSAIEEHTAHHRGSLAVYARLQGLTPAMPYMEMQNA